MFTTASSSASLRLSAATRTRRSGRSRLTPPPDRTTLGRACRRSPRSRRGVVHGRAGDQRRDEHQHEHERRHPGRGRAGVRIGLRGRRSTGPPLAIALVVEHDRTDRVLVRQLVQHLVDHCADVVLLVPEVVEQALQRRVGDLQLRRGQLEVIVEDPSASRLALLSCYRPSRLLRGPGLVLAA